MIYTDESTVKVDKTVLPGLFRKIEVKGDALIDEQDVQGSSKKPKQAIGYEDIKIFLELVLDDGPKLTKMQKLSVIWKIFRKPGQAKPEVHEIVNEHTAACGVKKVLFKNITHSAESKTSKLVVTLEFWEYTVMTITATKAPAKTASSSTATATSGNLNADYQAYLNSGRGTAPTSPAQDTASASQHLQKLGNMPY